MSMVTHSRPAGAGVLGVALPVQFCADSGRIAPFDWVSDDRAVPWNTSDEARAIDKVRVAGFGAYTHRVTKSNYNGDCRGVTHWLVSYR